MASTRAQEVAEVLFELKRAAKISTYQIIARRAGFSAGSKGRAMLTCLKTVRRDWPHLQWWRAIQDDGQVEKNSEHSELLQEAGYDIEAIGDDDEYVAVTSLDEHLRVWEDEEEDEA